MSELRTFSLPIGPRLSDFDEIFSELHGTVNDFFIQPDDYIRVRHEGRIRPITDTPVGERAMDTLINDMVPAPIAAAIKKGEPQSWSHRIRLPSDDDEDSPGQTLRFRCESDSMQTLMSYEQFGLTMRPIPIYPKTLDSLNLPPRLVDGLFPETGIVLFSGPTGSGKTTTLAATLREICYHPEGKVLLTMEDPLEYNLHALPNRTGVLRHAELGRNLESFPLGIKSALRKNPDTIMVGEMRDLDTILLGVEASQTGHNMYSTLHTNSCAGVFARMAQKLPEGRALPVMASFIEASRTFVYQRLYPAEGGGVVPVIEFVCLTPDDRSQLLKALASGGMAEVSRTMEQIMPVSGQLFQDSARQALEAGKITQARYQSITRSYEQASKSDTLI